MKERKVYNVIKRVDNEFESSVVFMGTFEKESDAIEFVTEEIEDCNENYIEHHSEMELQDYHFDNGNNGYAKIWRESDTDEIEIKIVDSVLNKRTYDSI